MVSIDDNRRDGNVDVSILDPRIFSSYKQAQFKKEKNRGTSMPIFILRWEDVPRTDIYQNYGDAKSTAKSKLDLPFLHDATNFFHKF